MVDNFNYKLNPAYCLYRGIAIEEQNGCKISFYVSDKKDRKSVRKGFYDFVDYVRTLNECPPEYNKKPSVRFKLKKRTEIEKVISNQIMKLYTPEQFSIIEQACKENCGLVVISSEEYLQSYDDYLHLKFIENPNSYFEKEFWSIEGKTRIKQKLSEGKLVFVEMSKSNVFEVVRLLAEDGVLSDELLRVSLKCVIIQECHAFSGNDDLLADVAVFKKNAGGKSTGHFSLMSEEEIEDCFNHYTNFGMVLRDGMDRLIENRNKNSITKKSVLGMIFGVLTLFNISGCSLKENFNSFVLNKSDYEIRKEFVSTCFGNGYESLNLWQQSNREKWNLRYIGWCKAEEFVLDRCVFSDDMPLYYGCWKNSDQNRENGFQEIYFRSKFLRNQEKKKSEMEIEIIPYQINGNIEKNLRDINFEYVFTNKSSKNVKSYTIVFYLFDMDGNPPETLRNNIVVNENNFVDAYSYVSDKINLENFFEVIPDEEYTAEFLYVSKIEFTDDSVWTDPFGIKYFQ